MNTKKRSFRLVSLAALSSILVHFCLLAGCKEDPPPAVPPEPTQAEIVTGQLTKSPWPLTSVVVEGENAAELFKDFSITFTSTSYTTTGTTPVWKRSGTWIFTDANTANKFKRDDNVEVTIESINDTQLKLSLFWEQEIKEGGRSKALRGKHEFVLSK